MCVAQATKAWCWHAEQSSASNMKVNCTKSCSPIFLALPASMKHTSSFFPLFIYYFFFFFLLFFFFCVHARSLGFDTFSEILGCVMVYYPTKEVDLLTFCVHA